MLKILKKLCIFIVLVPVMFCFTACGKSKKPSTPQTPPSQIEQGGNDNAGNNENQGDEGSGNTGDNNTGDNNTDSGNKGDENIETTTTISIDEFILEASNLNSSLPENYVSKITSEDKDGNVTTQSQFVNIIANIENEKLSYNLKSVLKTDSETISYMYSEISVEDNITDYTGVIIDENNKLYYYLGDFKPMFSQDKQEYKTYNAYQKMLESISPIEGYYYFNGLFISNFKQIYMPQLSNYETIVSKKSFSNSEEIEYKVILKISENESLTYCFNFEGNDLQSLVKTYVCEDYTKVYEMKKDETQTIVTLPDYSSVESDYFQEYLEKEE